MGKKKKVKYKLYSKLMYLLFSGCAVLIALLITQTSFQRIFKSVKRENCCLPADYSGNLIPEAKEGIFEGSVFSVPDIVFAPDIMPVLGSSSEERWIEVDLSDQKLYAWQGSTLFLETLVSSGLPRTPTPTGEFRIWIKLRAARMVGGEGRYYYNLPNVPYIMYFANDKIPPSQGYGLHGAYWHNAFGTRRSHGCVNLPIPIAKELYYWTSPTMAEGKSSVRATADNPGTRIVIHE